MDKPIRMITVKDAFGDEYTVLRQFPDGIYAEAAGQQVKLTPAQLYTIRKMLDHAGVTDEEPPPPGRISPAELDRWKDPGAVLTALPPEEIPDPRQHACPYHPELTGHVPIAVRITTSWPMTSTACRPCGESILAVLHGTPLTAVPCPTEALEAAQLSLWMADTLGQHDATVTVLRPRGYDEPSSSTT